MVLIRLDDVKIRDLAHNLSLQNKTKDELIWLFAETELCILSALVIGHLSQESEPGDVREVEVDPELLVDHPSEAEIRPLAEEIAKMGPTLQNLHWFVAERRFIIDRAKAASTKSTAAKKPVASTKPVAVKKPAAVKKSAKPSKTKRSK